MMCFVMKCKKCGRKLHECFLKSDCCLSERLGFEFFCSTCNFNQPLFDVACCSYPGGTYECPRLEPDQQIIMKKYLKLIKLKKKDNFFSEMLVSAIRDIEDEF